MAVGPGKYDDLCTYVRSESQAQAVMLIVINGNRGNAFECQADSVTALVLASAMRQAANQIERDAARVMQEEENKGE